MDNTQGTTYENPGLQDTVNVLIVNKDRMTSQMLARALSLPLFVSRNYHVDIADQLKDGREMLDNNDYHLVLSGLGYDWGDGWAFIRYVKEKGCLSIVMTGHGETERERAMKEGADGFLAMPFSAKDDAIPLIKELLKELEGSKE